MGALAEMRELNRLRVVDELRRRGSASRSEIAGALDLSGTTIKTLVSDLMARGLVVEQLPLSAPDRSRGRPPALLRLDSAAGAAVGVDFGHGHLRVAVADLAGTVLIEECVELEVQLDAHAALDTAASLARRLLDEVRIPISRVVGAGMGLPGPVDPQMAMLRSSAILRGWAGLQAARELGRRLHVPVTVDNDANLGALAESQLGAGRGREDLIYVTISSGIGAGLVLGGRLHHGVTGIAGEIGHVQVSRDGVLCRCGNRGCLETVASSGALLTALRPTYGAGLTVTAMLELAAGGDVGVQRVIKDAGRAIGRALADLCNSLNPDTIVVGGDLSGAGAPLLEGIRESIDRYSQPGTARAVELMPGLLGARATVLGALTLVVGGANWARSLGLTPGAS
jgi:predicted NBD/HSP70 family sugar kinase